MNSIFITEEFLYNHLSLIIASVIVIWFGGGIQLLWEACHFASFVCVELVVLGYTQPSTETTEMTMNYLNAIVNDCVNFVVSSILQDTSIIQKFKVLNHDVYVILTIFAASTIFFFLLLSVISAGERIASFVAFVITFVAFAVLSVPPASVGALLVCNSVVKLEASIPKFKVPYDIDAPVLIMFTVAIISWATETFGILTPTARDNILILFVIVLRMFLE